MLFSFGFDSGEFGSESACAEDKSKDTQLQMRDDHGDVVFAANGCYTSFSGIAIRELGHNSGACKHKKGYSTRAHSDHSEWHHCLREQHVNS